MLVPIYRTILPKTLPKWTTSETRLTTKFKTKIATVARATRKGDHASAAFLCQTSKTTTTITTAKQYCTSSTEFCLSIFIIAQICLNTVIKNLSSLMNDFRIKSRYLTTTTNNSTLFSSSSLLSLSSSSVDSKYFNNNYRNNHRTYNNSGKSNKVFLHYTPRDPRLRIFKTQKPILTSLNKHLVVLQSDSELKITEDLCNYGELIGGGINETNDKRYIRNSDKNNSSIFVKTCELNKSDSEIVNLLNAKKSVQDNRRMHSQSDLGKQSENQFGKKSENQSENQAENYSELLVRQLQQRVQQLKSFAQGRQNNWSVVVKEIIIIGVCF